MGDDRNEIDPIIENFIPVLANALKLSINQNSNDALNTTLVIFKSIYYSVRFNLPNHFNNNLNLEFWLQSFYNILETPL